MDSAVLDTALGLAFVFFAASLVCSGVVEWFANILSKRATFLVRGIRQLLDGSRDRRLESRTALRPANRAQGARAANSVRAAASGDPGQTIMLPSGGLAEAVLGHPLVTGLQRPSFRKTRAHAPSYIAAETFARSLIDLLIPAGTQTSATAFLTAAGRLPGNVPGRDALIALARDAGDDVDRLRVSIERWYDDQMQRVSGWYKRWSKKWLIVFALAVTLSVQIDAIAIAGSLYRDEPVRNTVVAQAVSAQACPDQASGGTPGDCIQQQRGLLSSLSLPIGWDKANLPEGGDWQAWLLKVLGWLITALAASLGAPFWFEALGKLGSWRNSGPKPKAAP